MREFGRRPWLPFGKYDTAEHCRQRQFGKSPYSGPFLCFRRQGIGALSDC
jgi:hypothetical protein